MATPTNIRDSDSDYSAIVTKNGELVVSSLSYSVPYYVNLTIANTAYEIAAGAAGKIFVITGVFLATDKNFASSTAGERVTIYGAHPADIDTNLDTIFSLELLRNDRFAATGLNLVTAEACSIVGISPVGATVDVTVSGYYVDA